MEVTPPTTTPNNLLVKFQLPSLIVLGSAGLEVFIPGNSLAVQWLGLGTFTAMARIQSLFGELRSHKLPSAAKKKKFSLLKEISFHQETQWFH